MIWLKWLMLVVACLVCFCLFCCIIMGVYGLIVVYKDGVSQRHPTNDKRNSSPQAEG